MTCRRRRTSQTEDQTEWPGLEVTREQLLSSAIQLDGYRQQLAADHPAIGGLLFDIEATAFQQARREAMEGVRKWSQSSSLPSSAERQSAPSPAGQHGHASPQESEPQPIFVRRSTKSKTPSTKRAFVWKKRPDGADRASPAGETTYEVAGGTSDGAAGQAGDDQGAAGKP